MKKISLFFFAVSFLFAACNSDDDIQTNIDNAGIRVIAELPQVSNTRVAYSDGEGTPYAIKAEWEDNDKVWVYMWENFSGGQLKDLAADIVDNGFELIKIPVDYTYFYSSYPSSKITYSITNQTSEESYITFTPGNNEQKIFKNISDLKTNNILVGAAKYNKNNTVKLNYRNIYSLLKVTVKVPEEVSSITGIKIGEYYNSAPQATTKARGSVKLEGASGSIVWDKLTPTAYYKNATFDIGEASDGYKECTFYVLMTPQDLDGIYIQVTDGSKRYFYAKEKGESKQTISAGTMYSIKAKLTETSVSF